MGGKLDFIEIYRANIRRAGADGLLAWLEKTDFFTAPASTRFHGAHEGGLCEHSLNVYRHLREMMSGDPEQQAEKIAIAALLHDLCKVGFYTVQTRNVKENGVWTQKPYYAIDDQFPFGHGEKSVYLIQRFMGLKTDEAMAIRWHMGDYSERGQSEAFERYPLALLLHQADERATYFTEAAAAAPHTKNQQEEIE